MRLQNIVRNAAIPVFLVFALFIAPANAADNAQAKAFIQNMGDEVIGYLVDDNIGQADRKDKLATVLKAHFDTKTISRFAMGQNWKTLSAEQQDEYRTLFEKMIVAIYSEKFAAYDGQQFEVDQAKAVNDKDYIVQSRILQNKGKDVTVSWQIRFKDDEFRIIDVKVEGVSMVLTQKSEFSSIIQRKGGNPAIIIDYLRQKTKAG